MRFCLLFLAVALLPVQASSHDARPQDVSSIDGIIRAYYEVVSGPAGAAADAQRDRTRRTASRMPAV
jgi:hypothetical protein